MKYARLLGGSPQYAPNPLHYGSIWRCNPPEQIYRAQGYKPVQPAELPEIPEGYDLRSVWTETEEALVQQWVLEPRPAEEELTPEEALTILTGGAAQ